MKIGTWNATLFAILANSILGLSSIYWALFEGLSPVTLVEYRVLFSLLVLFIILLIRKDIYLFWAALNIKIIFIHTLAAFLVAINWGTFIWASMNSSVLESGLGYLVAPVVTITIGRILFKEEMLRSQKIALTIIVVTIVLLIVEGGNLNHWVYLIIALTWGGYTVLKKTTTLSPTNGLFLETIILTILLVFSIIFHIIPFFDTSIKVLIDHPLIITSGIISVIPLILFSISAQKLSSYDMGLLQFFLPTVQVLVSFLYFNQTSTMMTYIGFLIIWITLFVASSQKTKYMAPFSLNKKI